MNRLGRTMFKYVLLPLMAVFAPIVPMLITVFALIIFDLISGILASLKRGESFKSSALRRTVTKFFVYDMAIIAGFITEKYLLNDSLPLVKIVAGIISVTELSSLYENLNIIYGSNIFNKILAIFGSKNDSKFNQDTSK